MSAGASALLLALLPTSWLLPNHYPPWVSAWHEGLAILLLVFAALLMWRRAALQRPWFAAGLAALGSIALQAASGRIAFGGDALMAAIYVGILVMALAVGNAAVGTAGSQQEPPRRIADDPTTMWALGTVAGATACVAIALVQWTDIRFSGLWIADLPPRGRPFSNLAQPNHFSTAAFLGLTSLALLREAGRIGAAGFWTGAAFMLLGIVMSGSRAAWVQMAIAGALCLWIGRRSGLKVRLRDMAGLVLVFLALQSAWSPLDDLLGRRADRPLGDKLAVGARPVLWRDALAAIAREPWWGHGWQQIGAAQQSVALDRPPEPALIHHFDHAHNIVLDLFLWAGLPVGATIALLISWALWAQLRRLKDPRAVWLMAGALGLLAHGMLEFPLEFAYFLIPLGVALGMVQGLSGPGPSVSLPRWALPAAGAALGALLMLIGVDYLKAEENYRVARMEIARIGTDRITSSAPQLRVLSQLEAFLHFARTEAKPGMTAQELEQMRLASRRFGFAPSLFRYAMALGLNGRPDEAARTLKLICHIHAIERCQEVREAWPTMQQRHEALRAVPPP